MFNKKVWSFLFVALFALTFSTGFVSAATGWEEWGAAGNFMRYIFGEVSPTVQSLAGSALSAIIVTIAVWLLVMITFGDLITTFSTFSPWVSWGAAVLMGIIAANLGVSTAVIAWTTGFFVALGSIAIFVGLGAAFLAFLVANLGIWKFRGWLIRRKALMAASTAESGGTRVAGAIRGLGNAADALSEVGNKTR